MTSLLANAAARARAYTSDSRNFESGDIFVALKGEKSDGHAFVEALLVRGPELVVVQKGWKPSGIPSKSEKLLEVDDTHAAHRELAGLFRAKFRGKLVAIGGSSGKTSAKEFLAELLGKRFKIVKTERSQNGELGIPKTLEQLRPGVEVAVVEVGIDAPGDMARHAALVNPDIAVLTSIGEEHLNLLKSVENVFKEEKILFDVTLQRKGICFAPGSDTWLRRLSGTEGVVLVPADPTLFSVKAARALRDRLPNDYAIQNATLALSVARELGLSEAELLEGIEGLALPEGRGNLVRLANNLTVVADHYNSNPSSLKASLASAAERVRHDKLPLDMILGDMLDLGDATSQLHASIVGDIARAAPRSLWLVGSEMARLAPELRKTLAHVETFANSSDAADAIRASRPASATLLLKGSRGMKLEKILEALK